jgi:intracellular sulfur oxidation DsrE/DsrF family protein
MAEETRTAVMQMRLLMFSLAATLAVASQTWAQPHNTTQPQSTLQTKWIKTHRVVIQVDQDDPKTMNLALNNAENMKKYYEGKGDKIEIEFVAFGPGLAMMRSDTSPVRERLTALSTQGIKFSGCGNTMANQSKAENKPITLLAEVREVPTGVARITELEEAGWTYLRP